LEAADVQIASDTQIDGFHLPDLARMTAPSMATTLIITTPEPLGGVGPVGFPLPLE
jgi:hypothetical protein